MDRHRPHRRRDPRRGHQYRRRFVRRGGLKGDKSGKTPFFPPLAPLALSQHQIIRRPPRGGILDCLSVWLAISFSWGFVHGKRVRSLPRERWDAELARVLILVGAAKGGGLLSHRSFAPEGGGSLPERREACHLCFYFSPPVMGVMFLYISFVSLAAMYERITYQTGSLTPLRSFVSTHS